MTFPLIRRLLQMVVIRLSRQGSKHDPKYRVMVADSRRPRDGKFIEIVGRYNPMARGSEKKIDLKLDRIQEWINKGAQPSDTVKSLIRKAEQPA